MQNQIAHLYQKAQKDEKLIIGLMSGTSMDGLDIALCRVVGFGLKTKIEVLFFTTAPYTDLFRSQLKAIFSKRMVDLELVCLMNEQVARVHADLINQALADWGYQAHQIDFIASHGQTIYHAPRSLHKRAGLPNGTLQIGDGDHLAYLTQIITLSDFRQKHISAGGEGAPLAVYADYLLFSRENEDRILLNIGGISNFTFLPGDLKAAGVFSSDLGPGNTLMDQWVQKHFAPLYFDEDARIARQGTCIEALLTALGEHPFFNLPLPKTTGPELFDLVFLDQAMKHSGTENCTKADVLNTLCHFTAQSIAKAVRQLGNKRLTIYQSGGGLHNPLLQELLRQYLPDCKFFTTEFLGLNPDAKEAALFALLANETLAGQFVDYSNRQGMPSVFMGKISLPR